MLTSVYSLEGEFERTARQEKKAQDAAREAGALAVRARHAFGLAMLYAAGIPPERFTSDQHTVRVGDNSYTIFVYGTCPFQCNINVKQVEDVRFKGLEAAQQAKVEAILNPPDETPDEASTEDEA